MLKSQFDTGLTILTLCLLTACSTPEKIQFEDAGFKVQTLRYSSKKQADKTILIIPPTGGTNPLDKSYASAFYKNGYQVYILDSWTGDTETVIDFEIHQRFYTNAQKAISLVLKNVTTPFVGLLGTSVGGLHASIAASTQDQLDAVFVITAGTPIAEVVVLSEQKAMQDLNQRRKEKFKTLSDQDQIQRIQAVFQLEPLNLGTNHQKKHLGVSIATQDTVVPTAQQEKLKDFWKPETVIEIKNNHFFGILKTWLFHRDKILNFFDTANREMTSSQKVPSTEY